MRNWRVGLDRDPRDAHSGVGAAVTAAAAHALPALLLEHANLRAAALTFDDREDLRACNERRAREHVAAVVLDEQDLAQRHFIARLRIDTVHADRRSRRHPYLVTTALDNRVHGILRCSNALAPSWRPTQSSKFTVPWSRL